MSLRLLGTVDPVVPAVQDHGRHLDARPLREPALDRVEARIARRIAMPMPVEMDHHRDEVGVVEGDRDALEDSIVEPPARRPVAPEETADLAPILLEPQA